MGDLIKGEYLLYNKPETLALEGTGLVASPNVSGFSQSEVIVERVVGFPYGLLQRIGSPGEVDNFPYRCGGTIFWVGIAVFIHFPTDCTIMRVCLRFTVGRITSDMGGGNEGLFQ